MARNMHLKIFLFSVRTLNIHDIYEKKTKYLPRQYNYYPILEYEKVLYVGYFGIFSVIYLLSSNCHDNKRYSIN